MEHEENVAEGVIVIKRDRFVWLEPGGQLRKLREKHGVSRCGFAQIIGVSEDTLKNYELGRTAVPKEIIQRVCEIYFVMPNYFYLREENSFLTDMVEFQQLYVQSPNGTKKKMIEIMRILST